MNADEHNGFFESVYRGVPPWDIRRPQPEFITLVEKGEIRGSVLEVGCGTGENALFLAASGHEVWGIDSAPTAIEKAKAKALERGLDATFRVLDALNLQMLGRVFDTVIDSGLFHVFSDEERPVFRNSLDSVLRTGGTYFMLCFSEREPGSWGPRRVTQAEIRSIFRDGWKINFIRKAGFDSNYGRAQAWLSSITKMSQ